MNCITALQWLQALTKKLRSELEQRIHDMETLPLHTTISFEKDV
jgi:hypothetical protein